MKKVFLNIFIFLSFVALANSASIVNDFDLGNPVESLSTVDHNGVKNNTCNSGYESDFGGIWNYETDHTNGDDPQTLSVVSSGCVDGSCLKVEVLEATETSCDGNGVGNYYLYAYSAFNSKPIMDQAENADQLTFYIKLPTNYPETNNYNLNVGTYVKDDSAAAADSGPHYYHWFDLLGSNYWTKIIVNQHPQNEVGQDNPPGNNPQTYDYLSHLYRFYIDGVPCSPIGAFEMYLDEIQFEELTEANDDENIASVSIGYSGSAFRIQWYRETHLNYATPTGQSGHTYTLRWSNNIITNANFSSATLVSDNISRNTDTSELSDEFEHTFTISPNTNIIYFGIYDNTADNGTVTKFNYIITTGTNESYRGITVSAGVSIGN